MKNVIISDLIQYCNSQIEHNKTRRGYCVTHKLSDDIIDCDERIAAYDWAIAQLNSIKGDLP